MSGKTPAKRGGDWNGQHPAWSRPPFEEGNRCAVRHSLYLTKFSDEDRAEIAELAASLRAAVPIYSVSFEPTVQVAAVRIWRWRRSYVLLADGAEVSQSHLRDLNVLERTMQRDFADLGVSPRAAAELGVNVARLAATTGEDEQDFDWNALSLSERRTLSALLAKGSADD